MNLSTAATNIDVSTTCTTASSYSSGVYTGGTYTGLPTPAVTALTLSGTGQLNLNGGSGSALTVSNGFSMGTSGQVSAGTAGINAGISTIGFNGNSTLAGTVSLTSDYSGYNAITFGARGATIDPGEQTGNATGTPGTINLYGNLYIAGTSLTGRQVHLNYDLGQPGVAGGASNDLLAMHASPSGYHTLEFNIGSGGGTLAVNNLTSTGTYTIINGYTGYMWYGGSSAGGINNLAVSGVPSQYTSVLNDTGTALQLLVGTGYAWNGGSSGTWGTPGNWTPSTNYPGSSGTDIATVGLSSSSDDHPEFADHGGGPGAERVGHADPGGFDIDLDGDGAGRRIRH